MLGVAAKAWQAPSMFRNGGGVQPCCSMGCGASALVPQPAPKLPLLKSAVSTQGSLELKLGDSTTNVSASVAKIQPVFTTYVDAASGAPLVTLTRTHWPAGTVHAPTTAAHEINGPCSMTFAVGASGGKVVAKLLHGPNRFESAGFMNFKDKAGYNKSEGVSVLYAANAESVEGHEPIEHDGITMCVVGRIKNFWSRADAAKKVGDGTKVFLGGYALYTAQRGGGFATEPVLRLDPVRNKVFNGHKEAVAFVAENYGVTAGPKKVTIAEGVDALLILALASEKDANAVFSNAEMRHIGADTG